MIFSIPSAILVFLAVWIGTGWNWKTGLVSACAILLAFLLLALYFILTMREIGWLDVFLPVPFAVVWTIMISPLLLAGLFTGDIFHVPDFIGIALLLTLSLWMVKKGDMSHKWLIVPILSFIYEMLPVDIPGPIDDMFALSGAGISAVIQLLRGASIFSRRVEVDKPEGKPKALT